MTSGNTFTQFREELRSGNTTCIATVSQFIERINSRKNLNAFLEVYEVEAIERAKLIDDKISKGTAGRLAGLVLAVKDNICYAGHHLSNSSKILEGFESLYSATVIERLLAEDVIIIGRTNCDEFAMGSSNENSAYGPVLNPLNEELVPGGSSGGSAAAVAAELCHAALGSDTGGSIRQPASFCGVVGLRPTYGRLSRYGLLAFASSLDQIGVVSHNIEDCALLLEIMAGQDEYDSTVSRRAVPAYAENLSAEGNFKIAYLGNCVHHEGVDSEIQARFDEVMESLIGLGHTSQNTDFPYLAYVVPTYYVLATAEASSNLSRYAGMHYGYRSKTAPNLESTVIQSRSEGFGPEVQRRILLGTFVLSEGFYDAYYGRAQKVRRLIADWTDKLLEENDFLLLPTAPSTAFRLGENTEDPIAMYLADIFTIQSALAGVPSISLPIGQHSNGMPFGLQLISKKFEEDKMLAFSDFLMKKFAI